MDKRQIDCLIATKVMGWIEEKTAVTTYWVGSQGEWRIKHLWKPTENMDDAWDVVEKVQQDRKLNCELNRRDADGGCFVSFITYGKSNEPHKIFWDRAKSAPLAICKAALKTVDIEV